MRRRAGHVLRVLLEAVRFGAATRRPGVALVILLGTVLSIVVVTVQLLAPTIVYPFL